MSLKLILIRFVTYVIRLILIRSVTCIIRLILIRSVTYIIRLILIRFITYVVEHIGDRGDSEAFPLLCSARTLQYQLLDVVNLDINIENDWLF